MLAARKASPTPVAARLLLASFISFLAWIRQRSATQAQLDTPPPPISAWPVNS